MKKDSIPWIEKYRPTNFEEIVLDKINRTLFENILTNNYFPNLLFMDLLELENHYYYQSY